VKPNGFIVKRPSPDKVVPSLKRVSKPLLVVVPSVSITLNVRSEFLVAGTPAPFLVWNREPVKPT
jgi:hypothetical protein